ncbi:hypothetical protein IW261DRAFT_1469767 [Armillaria novae-zelandiae]|uniref:Uncharacterized protein n=1 Tax=Armillaria novae-zelandiae TaxID=153914 RepID=A0AA39TE18_9AGAR|nr:hypothetical protein IW261DRAFT_1469767 [Armillaria novae-zelandiae]
MQCHASFVRAPHILLRASILVASTFLQHPHLSRPRLLASVLSLNASEPSEKKTFGLCPESGCTGDYACLTLHNSLTLHPLEN